MAAKTSDWRPGPTVCRCCFADGCYKDISTEYFWMGKREVYSEMLLETFDVSIAYAQTSGPNSNSRLICEPCISRLRDASDFKRQVQECEKVFLQHLAEPGSSLEFEILPETSQKEEVKLELERVKIEAKVDNDDDFDDHLGFDDDDDDDMDDEPLTKFASKVPKEESDDLMNILLDDETKKPEKRKSSTKVKLTVKKTKKKESPKPSASKASTKPVAEKKKKGKSGKERPSVEVVLTKEEDDTEPEHDSEEPVVKKRKRDSQSSRRRISKTKQRSIIIITKKQLNPPPKKKEPPLKLNIKWTTKAEIEPPPPGINKSYPKFVVQHSNAVPFQFTRGKFMCHYCKFTCGTMVQLRSHCITHDKTSPFRGKVQWPLRIDITDLTCDICNLSVNSVDNLTLHLQNEHGKVPPPEKDNDISVQPYVLTTKEYKCLHCSESFTNFLTLFVHNSKHYQNEVCGVCGKGFANKGKLRQHMYLHEEDNCACPKCGEVLGTRALRMRHMAYVHGKKNRYKCPLCDAELNSYYMRTQHLEREHGKKSEYRCTQCPLVFRTASCRNKHYKSIHLHIKQKKKRKNPPVSYLDLS